MPPTTRLLSPLVVTLTAFLVAGCSVFGGKAAEETPYSVVERDGEFEIRQYEDYAIARTFVEATYDEMDREAFGRLFDYITGENQTNGEVAMTAPVLMAPAGEEIAMTAPVLMEEGGEGWWMAFVLPDGMEAARAPVPTDPLVEVVDIQGPLMASLQYTGSMDEETNSAQAQRLRDWIAARGLEAGPGYQIAGYNPPWTLPFLRRNEILIALR
jgi:hypothetical protein